jgi:plasmid stabilization system protein ParE
MSTAYSFHPKAEDDFTDIWDFIAADSPDSADLVTDEIIEKIEGLVKFPHQGHRRTDLTSRPLRFWRVYDYLIAYAPDKRPLWVVALLHGHRSPRVMAAILRAREDEPSM